MEMAILIAGLAIFFLPHLVPMFPSARTRLAGALGEGPYKALFTGASLLGIIVIVWGKSVADFVPVYEPPAWGRQATMLLVLLAFICLFAFHLQGRIRRTLRHPFLTGIGLWGIGHLLANGDLASILLF